MKLKSLIIEYRELIWTLAKTDFKLRYQGSVLGYIWAILSPLLIFSILNFVFSSVFARGGGVEHYSLQLFVSMILFFFFSEGTRAGMASLLSKASLVTKIYVPRWTIILAATINSAFIFLMNVLIITVFFTMERFVPSFFSILFFFYCAFLTYIIILAFSLFTATFYVKFRDLIMIWEVVVRALFYATPIIYPLNIVPDHIQKVLLINPMSFIVHFNKEALINNHFPGFWQIVVFSLVIFFIFCVSIFSYIKTEARVAENI